MALLPVAPCVKRVHTPLAASCGMMTPPGVSPAKPVLSSEKAGKYACDGMSGKPCNGDVAQGEAGHAVIFTLITTVTKEPVPLPIRNELDAAG